MFSSSRGGSRVRLLAVHTTEGITSAKELKKFFDRPTATGSSHASADQDGVLLAGSRDGFVDYDRSAWTLRNGNPISDNIELCGFAKWKRPDWLARPKLLDACARWLAERSVARGVPLVKLSPKEVAAGRAGVIGHVDWTVGMGDGTHWDPGPDFPWDVVLDLAQQYAAGKAVLPPEPEGFLMALNDDQQAELYKTIMRELGGKPVPVAVWDDLNGNPLVVERNGGKAREARGVLGDVYVHTVALMQQVAGLTAAVNVLAAGAAGEGTTAEELRAVIREEMAKAIDVEVTVNGAKPA